ncbi:MAG: hypothetical protein VX899_17375 [Myxococcota bacterium]|nr:hypothetical protein [Myxococcota bacterium]
MLSFVLLLTGCSWVQGWFLDDSACSDGESQGYTNGYNDGHSDCEYDDDVPDAQLLDYPDAYAASSFVSCYQEGYAQGYNDGAVADDNTPTSECD